MYKRKRYVTFIFGLLFITYACVSIVYCAFCSNALTDSDKIGWSGTKKGYYVDSVGEKLYRNDEFVADPTIYGNLILGTNIENTYDPYILPDGYTLLTGIHSMKDSDKNISLTIEDENIQRHIIENFNGRNGVFYAYNMRSGKTISALSLPSSDYSNEVGESLFNKVFNGTYTPGSTMKVILAVVASEVNPDLLTQEYHCEGAYTLPDGEVVVCTGYHGSVDGIEGILEYSCNCAAAQLINQLDVDEANNALNRLGVYTRDKVIESEKLIDGLSKVCSSTAFENNGVFSDTWSLIGQGNSTINPIDFTRITCAIFNDGYVVEPYIVNGVVKDGNLPSSDRDVVTTQIMSGETANRIKSAWISACSGDNYRGDNLVNDIIPEITCAKTGTAEVDGKGDRKSLLAVSEKYGIVMYALIETEGGDDPSAKYICNSFIQDIMNLNR